MTKSLFFNRPAFAYREGMVNNAKFDPGLSRIMVVCLSLAFVILICSMEALRVTANGFVFAVTWRTGLAFALAALVVVPCFYTLVYTGTTLTRRVAKTIVVAIGITGFFYPLRFVPHSQMRAIFGGLALAIFAIGLVATFIYLLHRFLEHDTEEQESSEQ
jgi:lysylphosphatidylglycerol synthetase-like protein (DUF2156 family)